MGGGRRAAGGRAVAPTPTSLVSTHPPKIAIPLLGGDNPIVLFTTRWYFLQLDWYFLQLHLSRWHFLQPARAHIDFKVMQHILRSTAQAQGIHNFRW